MFERLLPESFLTWDDKVAKGEVGRKTGKGLYEWKNGKAVKKPPEIPHPLQPRCASECR